MGVVRDNRGWLLRRAAFCVALLFVVFGALLFGEGSGPSSEAQSQTTDADVSYSQVGSNHSKTEKHCDDEDPRCGDAPASGSIDGDCPAGTVLIVKFEVQGGKYVFEKGQSGVVTITNGTLNGGNFSSTVLIKAVVIKASTDIKVTTFSPATFSGAFDNSGMLTPQGTNNPDISNVRFCG